MTNGREPGVTSSYFKQVRVLQIVFLQGLASAKHMYFCKLSQICFRRNTQVLQAFAAASFVNMISQAFSSFRTIRKYGFAVFCNILQAFAIYSLAKFCKLTFARICESKLQKIMAGFFARFCNGHFADEAQAWFLLLPVSFVGELNASAWPCRLRLLHSVTLQ